MPFASYGVRSWGRPKRLTALSQARGLRPGRLLGILRHVGDGPDLEFLGQATTTVFWLVPTLDAALTAHIPDATVHVLVPKDTELRW